MILDETRDFEKVRLTLERTMARLASSKKELELQHVLYDELEKKYAYLQDNYTILKDAVESAN